MEHQSLTDHALDEQLERYKQLLVKFSPYLPDKGEKIRFKITSIEAEKQNRVSWCSRMKNDTQLTKAFSKKHKADNKDVTRPNNGRKLPKSRKAKHAKRKFYFRNISKGNHKSYSKENSTESSTYARLDDGENDFDHSEWSSKESPSQSSMPHKKSADTVIIVDEEEPHSNQVIELAEGLQQDIYYPTGDDPCSVQVCLEDLKCLEPGAFLTSSVMNFYMRFLQQQVSSTSDFHFFSTYFYKKLTDAVTYKGDNKVASFDNLRRWWKGVDLFSKAYIFIPIHDSLHWSLVIVCIPNKEDESRVTILHLDSLGLHSTKSILENVKWFLIGEWNYLSQDANKDDYSLDLPISRRIRSLVVQVPQQKNGFDCGTFVLLFMKRFMEDAPPRLNTKDLVMFNKEWFRLDEASALRIEIQNTLIDLFRVNRRNDQTQRAFDGGATSK